MNTEQFDWAYKRPPKARRSPEIIILDLTARFDFKTRDSISFLLMRADEPRFNQVGWIDVHHPCDHHIKVQIKGSLSQEYIEEDKLETIITSLFDALEIPQDETYEASFACSSGGMSLSRYIDRNGQSDRMVSKKRPQ